MGIIQYIKEVYEARRREKALKNKEKQVYKQLRKGGNENLQKVAKNVVADKSELIPKIVGAMNDDEKQIETVSQIADELPPERVAEAVNQIGDKAIANKFNTDMIPKKDFLKVLVKLAVAGSANKFVLALYQEENQYNNLYKVIDIIESAKANKKEAKGLELNHFQIIDIIKKLKQDDKIKDIDDEGKTRCIALYMAYKIAKYANVFPLSQFLQVLKPTEEKRILEDKRNDLPEFIETEYKRIREEEKVPYNKIYEYNKAEYKEQVKMLLDKEQADKELENQMLEISDDEIR